MLLNDMHTNWDDTDNDTRPAIATLHTDNSGYYNTVAKAVQITALELGFITDDCTFGELRVHFNTDSWRPDRDGLIYTNRLFEKELQEFLTAQGFHGSDCTYSEQGMQGDNFVSCDIGEEFIETWLAKYPDAQDAM